MAKVRQFLGWIIAGVILVAALGVFAGMALPLYGDISTKADEITTKAGKLQKDIRTKAMPKQEDIDGFNAAKQQLEAKRRQVVDFYRKYDDPLEQWFPGLSTDSKETPGASAFRTEWITKRNELDQRIKDWKNPGYGLGYHRPYSPEDYKIVGGFNWETIEDLKADEMHLLDAVKMRLFMKRYWIRTLIADLVTDPSVDAHRLLEVDFLRKIDKFDAAASAAGAVPDSDRVQMAVWDLGWLPGQEGSLGRQSGFDNEQVLPAELGETITFGFAVMLPYAKVPELLDRLMRVEEGKPLIHVVTTKIYVHDQNPFETIEMVDPGMKDAKLAELAAKYASRHPVVAITAYAVDFK